MAGTPAVKAATHPGEGLLGRSGLEVLAEVKASEKLLTIPVVMLSTSQDEADVLASYQLHANAYIAKPTTFDLFTEAIAQVTGLFLKLARLPAGEYRG